MLLGAQLESYHVAPAAAAAAATAATAVTAVAARQHD
jgi:hypothetical protein